MIVFTLKVTATTRQAITDSSTTGLMKMRRLFSKGTILLIWSGFALFFFTAQISIFQVTFHVDKNGASLGNGEATVVSVLEAHAVVEGTCYDFDLKCRPRLKTKTVYSIQSYSN